MKLPSLISLLLCVTCHAAEYYASPTGSSAAAGTLAAPLSLVRAVGDYGTPSPASAGDTIYLRGGTYYTTSGSLGTTFTAHVAGMPGNPVTIRPYQNEVPVIEATAASHKGLDLYASNTVWMGITVWNSSTDRTVSRGAGIWIERIGIKIINCIVHDTGSGILAFENTTPFEITGNLIYNWGYDLVADPARGHGHSIYVHSNAGGPNLIKDNISFNGFSAGLHCYSESPYTTALADISFVGNIGANSGLISTTGYIDANLLVGAASSLVSTNVTVAYNYGWHGTTPNLNFQVGYSTTENANSLVFSNYVSGGIISIGHWTNLTFTANTFSRAGAALVYNQSANPGTISWDANDYHTAIASPFNLDGVNKSWAQWQALGFDAASSLSASDPVATMSFVRANDYETGRANIAVYNWSGSDNVSVDISSAVTPGWSYTVRNAADWFGAIVKSGVYAGGSISLPMTNLTVATPVGVSSAAATGPAFNTFILQSTAPPSASSVQMRYGQLIGSP